MGTYVCQRCGKDFERPGKGRPPNACPDCKGTGSAPVTRLHPGVTVPTEGAIETAVRSQLDEAGRSGTIDGIAALHAAATLDSGVLSGSARAALLRELRAAAAAALAKPAASGRKLDELRQRREQRSG